MHFSDLGLTAEIQRAVAEQGYDTPTPIQQQAIPAVLAGHDLMATAQTGTGKTAGFTLPILHRLVSGPNDRLTRVARKPRAYWRGAGGRFSAARAPGASLALSTRKRCRMSSISTSSSARWRSKLRSSAAW